MTGTTLSHYKIVEELGRGGMGIVYKAMDTKLDRTVAIKILPASALSNEEDRARFYREAKAAAQLHHPHIASVFEIDEAVPEGGPKEEPRPFIAMEYIDGETLDQHIQKAPLKLEEAVRIAGQVAGALEAAHEKKIVHRDIKSANVMLTAKGEAKVLDFGLAQTTASTKLTRMGSTLGTIAYMSPEQARGEEVDHRTDLWSLGIMIYEMITGCLPFSAEYEQAAVYGILNEDPEPVTALRSGVPMDLEYIVNKLLSKEKKHRYQGAAELVADLSAIKDTTRSRTGSQSVNRTLADPSAAMASPKHKTRFSWIHGVVLLLAVVATWMLASGQQASAPSGEPYMHLSLKLPPDLPLSFFGASGLGIEKEGFDVSRDGRRLVYVTATRGGYYLVTHEMGTTDFVLKEEDAGAAQPAFSPDGSNIVYKAEGQIWVVPFESGTPVPIASESDGHVIYWSDDNWIYWADVQGTVLRRVRPNGAGGSEEVYRGTRNEFLNKGIGENDLLLGNGWENIITHFDSNGSTRVVSQAGGSAQLVDSDILVSTALGNLRAGHLGWADEGNADDSRIFRSGVRTGSLSGLSHFQITDSGTLFYAAGASAGLTRLVIRNPDGATNELSFDAAYHGNMDATRDGSVVIVELYDGSERTMLYDVDRGTSNLLFGEISSERPILNSSGSRITFSQSDPNGYRIMRQEANSSRAPEIIFESEYRSIPYDWSRDERFLLFGEATDTSEVIRVLDTSDSSVITVFETDNSTWSPKFSPDESMIAFTVVGPRGSEIFAEPFPATGDRWNVSGEFGGEEPEWREDTDQLIFRSGDSWYSASYSDENDGFERPELLFSGPYVNIGGMEYRVLNGGRILLQESVAKERTTNRIEVITGFINHVRRELAEDD